MNFLKITCKKFALIALFLSTGISSAFATGATVTIATTAAIPTLSGTMLIVLSLLLFAVAYKTAKQKSRASGNFFIGLIGTFALLTAGGGIKLVTDAHASGMDVPLIPGTQTYRLLNNMSDPNSGFDGTISNNSGQAIDVISIVPDEGSICFFTPNGITPCAGNTIPLSTSPIMMADGQHCPITCRAAGDFLSDIRLKRDIKFLSELENGIKLYSFKYISGYYPGNTTYVGVMAQDLLKHTTYKNSVRLMDGKFYGVNYHSLGLKMISLEEWKKSSDNIFILKT